MNKKNKYKKNLKVQKEPLFVWFIPKNDNLVHWLLGAQEGNLFMKNFD